MSKVFLSLPILAIALCVAAQLSPPLFPDIDDPDPPLPAPIQARLAGMIGSGVNYYAYVPKDAGDFEVVSHSPFSATIQVAGVSSSGECHTRLAEIRAGRRITLPAEFFQFAEEVHIFSLLPFEVLTARPVRLAGVETQSIQVRPPSVRLRIVQVAAPDGTERAMGVDLEGKVHYPVFSPNRSFGAWSAEEKAVTLEDGSALFQIHGEK